MPIASAKSSEETTLDFRYEEMNSRDMDKTTISDIAGDVRAFYDRHPYPPPVKNLDDYRRLWEDPNRRRVDYHLYWPTIPYRDGLNILVAGCGTAQAARHALRNPHNHVTGIDVSSTSIGHTEALKRKYELTNLYIHQLPVERAHALDQRFDLIICTGVLHHLPDPDVGLSALRNVLKPDGAMHVMVYATYGRTGVYMLQDYCRRLGVGRSDKDILDLANTLMALPPAHPLAHLLAESPDFKGKAGLADALLHPQDRSYTVPQFFDFIDQAGLTFGRWVRQAPYLPQCGALAQTPHAAHLNRLAPMEQYTALELFRGTMVRHSAIVYRSDRPGGHQPFQFDGESWKHFVPIRRPGTLSVEKNLPAGAATVLLNQSHTYSDLVLPIDVEQRRLFEAIDGHRCIAEILDRVATLGNRTHLEDRARPFFEQLWFYDQVVFDAYWQCGETDDGSI